MEMSELLSNESLQNLASIKNEAPAPKATPWASGLPHLSKQDAAGAPTNTISNAEATKLLDGGVSQNIFKAANIDPNAAPLLPEGTLPAIDWSNNNPQIKAYHDQKAAEKAAVEEAEAKARNPFRRTKPTGLNLKGHKADFGSGSAFRNINAHAADAINAEFKAAENDLDVTRRFGSIAQDLKQNFDSEVARIENSKGLSQEQKNAYLRGKYQHDYLNGIASRSGLDPEAGKAFKTYLKNQDIAQTKVGELLADTKRQMKHFETTEKSKTYGRETTRHLTEKDLRGMGVEELQKRFIAMGGSANYNPAKGMPYRYNFNDAKAEEYVKDKLIGRIMKRGALLESKQEKLTKTLDAIRDGKADGHAEAVETYSGNRRTVAQARGGGGAATTEKSGLKMGTKGKIGAAVAGIAALAGVTSLMFSGGKQSNAQLYNPNPQPQYY